MTSQQTYRQPNEQGYYGQFGGAYIPEMLHRNVEELRTRYLEIEPGTWRSWRRKVFKKSFSNC